MLTQWTTAKEQEGIKNKKRKRFCPRTSLQFCRWLALQPRLNPPKARSSCWLSDCFGLLTWVQKLKARGSVSITNRGHRGVIACCSFFIQDCNTEFGGELHKVNSTKLPLPFCWGLTCVYVSVCTLSLVLMSKCLQTFICAQPHTATSLSAESRSNRQSLANLFFSLHIWCQARFNKVQDGSRWQVVNTTQLLAWEACLDMEVRK